MCDRERKGEGGREGDIEVQQQYQSNLWATVGQATILCFRLWTHIFSLSQTSPQGVLGNKLHPTKVGALAYLHKDVGTGTRAPYKGQCKPQDTEPGLVSRYVRRLWNHIDHKRTLPKYINTSSGTGCSPLFGLNNQLVYNTQLNFLSSTSGLQCFFIYSFIYC